MSEKVELVIAMCENCLSGLEKLLHSIEEMREEGLDPTQLDIRLYPEFSKIYQEFYEAFEKLVGDESEEWYVDDLSIVLADLFHAYHVVNEEQRGLCEFGWAWEKCIDEWKDILTGVVQRLQENPE